MAFKITKNTRIKIREHKLQQIWQNITNINEVHYNVWLWNFEDSAGLKQTSQRISRLTRSITHYYQVVDVNKYVLAKLKYGI